MDKPDDDPIKKLGEMLQELINKEKLSRKNLKPTLSEPSIAQLVAEGNLLLEEETKTAVVTKKKSVPVEIGPKVNPYQSARLIVLKKMDAWNRNEILRMEKENDINNRIYDEFVTQQRIEGDNLSS
jgi:hypothetical protein